MALACVDDAYDRIRCPLGTGTGQKVTSSYSKHELLAFLVGVLVLLIVAICFGTLAVKLYRRRQRRREMARRNQAQVERQEEDPLFSNVALVPPSSPKSKKKKYKGEAEEEEQACYADASGCLLSVPEEPLSTISFS